GEPQRMAQRQHLHGNADVDPFGARRNGRGGQQGRGQDRPLREEMQLGKPDDVEAPALGGVDLRKGLRECLVLGLSGASGKFVKNAELERHAALLPRHAIARSGEMVYRLAVLIPTPNLPPGQPGIPSMQKVNVLSIVRLSPAERAKIETVDARVQLTDAGGWFDGEYRDTWPAFASARYLSPRATGSRTREERDRLLADAEVIVGSWPFPLDLRKRGTRLKWFHQRPAGASNLLLGDLWGSDVVATTSRGAGNTLAMAEYALAGILYFAKGLRHPADERAAGKFDFRAYLPLLVEGKPACVVGAGGIGREVGRLCAALGMRVVGTRRHPEADALLPPGFVEIGGAADLDRYLPESDFVIICCQWTPET